MFNSKKIQKKQQKQKQKLKYVIAKSRKGKRKGKGKEKKRNMKGGDNITFADGQAKELQNKLLHLFKQPDTIDEITVDIMTNLEGGAKKALQTALYFNSSFVQNKLLYQIKLREKFNTYGKIVETIIEKKDDVKFVELMGDRLRIRLPLFKEVFREIYKTGIKYEVKVEEIFTILADKLCIIVEHDIQDKKDKITAIKDVTYSSCLQLSDKQKQKLGDYAEAVELASRKAKNVGKRIPGQFAANLKKNYERAISEEAVERVRLAIKESDTMPRWRKWFDFGSFVGGKSYIKKNRKKTRKKNRKKTRKKTRKIIN